MALKGSPKDKERDCIGEALEAPSAHVFADFRPLFPYLRPLWGKFLLGVIAGAFYGVASGLGLPALTKTALPIIFNDEKKMEDVPEWFLKFFEQAFGGDANALLIGSCLAIPAVFVVRAFGGFWSSYLMTEIGMRAVEGFRGRIFDRLLALPLSFYNQNSSGDLLARLLESSTALQGTVSSVAGDLVKQPILLVSALIYLISEAIKNEGVFFALIGALSIPLLVFPIRALGKRLRKRSGQLQATAGELSGMVTETLSNPLEVRAYNLQGRLGEDFRGLNGLIRRFQLKLARYSLILSPAVEVFATLGFALSLYLGAKKGMELEDFIGMAFAMFMAYEPIKKMGALHGSVERAKAAMERINYILASQTDLPEPTEPTPLPEPKGGIEFSQVRFGYGNEEVLKGLSLAIRPQETVALIGESGGGKTTFVNLIARFYDVTEGAVMVDGCDVREYSLADLRSRVALVPQMPVLFRGTIRENILMGRPEASDEEVQEAARKAFAHDFILRQEEGYETKVSERGGSLSGGQRQRIAIARAFLKDAPILIMDESTSALDAESEAKVQEAMKELASSRTTLLISHRESSLQMASRVFSFDKGNVTELVDPASKD